MSPQHILLLIGIGAISCVDGFQANLSSFLAKAWPQPPTVSSPTSRTQLFMAAGGGKGFGESKAKARVKGTPSPPRADTDAPVIDYDAAADAVAPSADAEPEMPRLNAGQQALARMRKERQDKKDSELRAIKEIRAVDELVKEDATAQAIPEKVAMRMGKRMLPFVGIPLFGGMGAFVAFWYFATYKNIEFEPVTVAASTIALLAVGLVGITYSVLSASWDEDREGSGLGFDEFSKNVGSLKEGLSRSQENALLRERMAGMPEEEIEKALRDLDNRDEKNRREKESFSERMRNEME